MTGLQLQLQSLIITATNCNYPNTVMYAALLMCSIKDDIIIPYQGGWLFEE